MHLQLAAAGSLQPSPVQINTVDNKGMSIVTELVAYLLFPLFLLTLSHALSPFSLFLVFPRGVEGIRSSAAAIRTLGENGLLKRDPSAQ